MRIQYDEMKDTIKKAYLNKGVNEDDAAIMAKVHTDSSLKGIYSHGLNRVPLLLDFLDKGWVDPNGKVELLKQKGGIEHYDGNRGFGVLNALFASHRACELAKEHGIAMVTLRNTTHWMRGGTYVEEMVKEGMISMIWTNTESVMPVWGSKEASIGNNPMGIGIPSKESPVVLDFAMALYSYGKLQTTRLAGEKLPYPGGYNEKGEITDDPAEIEKTRRVLPIGYWKGSGFAICLDLMAGILSKGLMGLDLDRQKEETGAFNCSGCSQIFIAIDPETFGDTDTNEKMVAMMKEKIHSAQPIEEGKIPSYPGENSTKREKENREKGIPVVEEIWKSVCEKA